MSESLPENDSTLDLEGQEGAEPKSMLEAVQAALEPIEAPATTEAKAESPTAGEPEAKADETPTQKVDEYAEVPFNKHPRFRQLLKERSTLKEQVKGMEAEVAQLKGQASSTQDGLNRFNSFAGAVRSAGLDAQEVNDGFAIMSEMKRNPERALQMITPYVNSLLVATGRKLEGDLGKQVQDGLVDGNIAGQLQRERHARQRLEQQAEGQRQAFESRQQEADTQALVQSVTAAVSAWEERQKADPDYQKKQPLIMREIGWLMQQEGYPRDSQTAVNMAERARKSVETNLSGLLPARQAVRTVTGGSSAASAAARPKTMQEAVRLAASGAYQPS